ncbi:hypothetical protein Q9292_09535 [Methylophilus sp. VKM B-3414]|uniref:hypothetical protein n=1 Tax=Methylophilus sp. VKM B-3414 TaxID=3076121 RepID=UPI0028CAE5B9|nr:hypothetical protein [Methylophilus sp. VKM B-3414]MDT7849851.1 hypothetical protein [Methylophilus sp. VKM B-3414]
MDKERINILLAELEELVPIEGAEVQFLNGPEEALFKATEAGYLRFGLEFMKGAFLPKQNEKVSDFIPMNLESIVTNDSTVAFDCFLRVDSLQEPDKPSPSNKVIGWALAITGSLLVTMLVIGVFTTIAWLFK